MNHESNWFNENFTLKILYVILLTLIKERGAYVTYK